MLESDILFTAIDNLQKQTGADIEVDNQGVRRGKQIWDALIKINFGKNEQEFGVEIQRQVHRSNVMRVIEQINGGLLVAQYISQPGKEFLEEKNVNYLDIAGNCYIKSRNGLFWKINTQKSSEIVLNNKHRAIHKNGIKLIFALLVDNELINQPYRVQAERAGIALSTVGGIHQDLKQAKFIYQVNKKIKQLTNKKELFQQWVVNYNQRLRPKLLRGTYRFISESNLQNWQKTNLQKDTFWGGEPAADLLTNYLQPELFTLYSNLDKRQLRQQLNLIAHAEGKVKLYNTFWSTESHLSKKLDLSIVHPMLVYADLASTTDSRNLETMNKIYEKYLKNLLESNNG